MLAMSQIKLIPGTLPVWYGHRGRHSSRKAELRANHSGTESILGLHNINAAKEKMLKMKVSATDKPLFAEMRNLKNLMQLSLTSI